ncbi:hypothetical protein [Burkholderia territorii]|uniref:hypothetical protein n=1 Tax=Burkholderia territorii TaxID=1503055 RepID=UPI000AE95AC5|nr:hypothetical protein [Burkholderia territorii]
MSTPTPEEAASYFDQDYGERTLIEAMGRIGQTYAHSGHYGPDGSYQIVAIRTDHIGAVRRFIADTLMRMIGWLARPEHSNIARAEEGMSNPALTR